MVRITVKVAYPITALMGIVKIHAHTNVRATFQRTVLTPIAVPTPIMDDEITWVVLTGMPIILADSTVAVPAVSAANPLMGFRRVIFMPIV